jgi:hypothetical protein
MLTREAGRLQLVRAIHAHGSALLALALPFGVALGSAVLGLLGVSGSATRSICFATLRIFSNQMKRSSAILKILRQLHAFTRID